MRPLILPAAFVGALACVAPEAVDDGAGETNTTDAGTGTEDGETTDSDTGEALSEFSYHQHIRPILDARCGACHDDGGIGPFSLTGYEAAVAWAGPSAEAIESRVMPPFPPDDSNCRELVDRRKMTDQEREMVLDWYAHGTPEGDPEAPPEYEPELPPSTLGEPDRIFDATVSYQPQTGEGDEYRCFLLDPELVEAWTFFRALGLETDNWSRIHHSIIWLVPPESVAQAQMRDAEDPEQGWSCYFGAEVDGIYAGGGFTPGTVQTGYIGGSTVPVPAGTQMIVEMHFHETYNEDPVEFQVSSWEFDDPPEIYPRGLDFFASDFFIPAGEPNVYETVQGHFIALDQEPTPIVEPDDEREAREGLIWGVDFHMHLRGKTASIELVREDGTRECLLWVPDWNDEWQGAYQFAEPVRAYPGDRIEATCHWDNSAENQPFVDGVQLEPTNLWWGFDALDEMCNGGVGLTDP